MVAVPNGPLVQPHAALRPAGAGHLSAKGVMSALLFVMAMAAIAAVVVAILLGESTVALVVAIITGAVFAALIV
ncbi:hypothetical protein [Mycolicibacterium mengxianglii]|uniref:hypothetical protein n=1 Tax=Mycolicibacterium mengxianglii TaxID=2736649 RepID=UPI0018D1AF88|nr:hypothetical protein [Mycolicibacterium mengxianglii]